MEQVTLDIVEFDEDVDLDIDDHSEEITLLIDTLENKKQFRQQVLALHHYIAKAAPGVAENEPYWNISRIEMHLDGTVTILKAINVRWSERLTANYL